MQTARVAEVSQLLPHPAPHKQQLIPLPPSCVHSLSQTLP